MATFMDTWSLEETLKVLSHTTSSSTLYRLLVKIREFVDWPKHKQNIIKIQQSGCIKYIVAALRSTHQRIINVALSILGNICMESKSSSEVFYHGGLDELLQLLKKYPQDNGINGRTFRIIGNICQHSMGGVILEVKPHLVTYIVKFVQKYAENNNSQNSQISESTLEMAVRALRQLLNGQSFFSIVKQFKVLNSIGMLLIKCTIRWMEENKDQHVLDGIIKFLLHYSRYRYYPGITELRNTPKGDSLVYLSKLLPLAPKRIVKIIMNFIRISQLKSDLPIPEICGGFCKLLRENPVVEDFKEEYRSYIKSLCYLMEHPANRDSNRCRETIPQLIKLLDEFHEPTEKVLESCSLIVATLDKCCYHCVLVKEQVQCQIIDILVKKIEWIVDSAKHKPHRKRKRKYSSDFSPSFKIGMRYPALWNPRSPQSPHSSDDEIELYRDYRCLITTASSSSSESEVSPSSSPNYLMPLPYPDLSDSEDYSPVCSDNEADNPNVKSPKEETPSNIDNEGMSEGDDDDSNNSTKVSIYTLKYRLLDQILNLLRVYCGVQPALQQLCTEKLMFALLKCGSFIESPYAFALSITLSCRIISIPEFLVPLMLTNVVVEAFSMTKMIHGFNCEKCEAIRDNGFQILGKFTNMAESGRGKGDIAHRLMVGTIEQKRKLMLTIPYIVRHKGILNSFMVNCGGLETLMQLLSIEEFQERSIKALCVLSINSLGISNPQQRLSFQREKVVIKDHKIREDCPNVVTFVLDDRSCLNADRDFLCKKSEFFNSLLNGGFKESTQNFVTLHHVGYTALKSLIHLLYSDFDKTEPKDVQLEIQTLLEVILLCDRYLLEDLCVYLTECVQQFAMTAQNVPLIYRWALESKTNILRIESIAFALVGEMEDSIRCQMFAKLLSIGYSKEIISDIQQLLMRYLTMRGSF